MPRKRIESKHRRDDVLTRPDGWLVFWLGWTFNKYGPDLTESFFESIEDMRQYYFANKSRVIEAMGSIDFWAWHKFEPHDRANCEFCQRYDIEN